MPGQWGWREGIDSWATEVEGRDGCFVMTPTNKINTCLNWLTVGNPLVQIASPKVKSLPDSAPTPTPTSAALSALSVG